MPRSIYVHVPFCEQICHYCDFNKFFLENQPIDEYLALCEKEMKLTQEKFPSQDKIETIYVGGGTPTSLSTEQLKRLLLSIKSHFPLADPVEWTVEVNPGSADKEKLAMLKEIGVNRLSIGAQTFDPKLLQAINRDHKTSDIERTVHMSREAGITNLSLDLMFGLPNQTMAQWESTLKEACDLPIEHISAYSLKVEAKTVFYQMHRKGQLSLLPQELEADMYEKLREVLQINDFQQYEISNFAKNGLKSEHNLTYWNNDEYYGIGAGAHSYVNGVRRANNGPLPKYMKALRQNALPYLEEHEVPVKEKMEEQMFMGLRKLEGISSETFYERFSLGIHDVFPDVIDSLKANSLLEEKNQFIRLTDKGLLLGNEVFEKFLLAD
ncbi:radical SAM family heme chaperone HemW [Salipaludibacillus sp. CF4.18]|uniref:radical SAM family heme chaperone HemW n=1 Tax=Salipaludibacillus sp. CF4.18 TaxID=3373081 RepID=UPI003EE56691